MTTKIAVDCRPLIGPRAGIGRYLFELLREFALRDDDVVYYLYGPGQIEIPSECSGHPRFRVRILRLRPAELWLYTVVPVWIERDNVDVFWGPNYSMPLVKSPHCRYVITVHDVVHARFPQTMLWKTRLHNQLMLRRYTELADLIIADSDFTTGELVSLFATPKSKIRMTHLGVRASAPNVERYNPDGHVLYVGTIEPRKNVERLVEAYSLVAQCIRQQHNLILAGGIGWGNLDPNALFDRHGVRGEARYMGRLSDDTLRDFYSESAIFVFPSLYEGFGLPVVEAMSRGVPVLCSYTSSLGEIGQEAAILCDPDSPEDIATKMEILLRDDVLLAEFSQRSRKRARRFSWKLTAKHTLGFLLGEDDN